MKSKNYTILLFCFSLLVSISNAKYTYAQDGNTFPVKGVVMDEKGEKLIGASVSIKDTKTGARTDINGEFTLPVSSGAVVKISYIGYKRVEILIKDQKEISLKMEPQITAADEVVVIGYGVQKKGNVANAVVQTNGSELANEPVANLSQTLQGRMAGVYATQGSGVPGFDDAKILVRGYNSFNNSGALVVIDGVANADPDGINRLDANDIESITVLKDGSAAIYGAQSAGGVILVTTKRGKVGKPTIEVSTSTGVQIPSLKVQAANASQFMNAINGTNALDGVTPTYTAAAIASAKSYDWWNTILRPVSEGKYSISVSGGTDKVKYFISGGIANGTGIVVGDDKTKLFQFNVRTNVDVMNVFDGLDASIDMTIRSKQTGQPQSDQLGGGVKFATDTDPTIAPFINNDPRYPSYGWSGYNPVAIVKYPGITTNVSNVYDGKFKLKYNIPKVEGLFLDGFASVVANTVENSAFVMPGVYYTVNPSGGDPIVNNARNTTGQTGLTQTHTDNLRITLNGKINYNRSFGKDHNLNAFVAYEQSQYNLNSFSAQRLGYPSADIVTLDAGNTGDGNVFNSGTKSIVTRQNVFGRVNYDFQNKYLLTVNFRADGSSKFAPGKQWGFFPGVSLGWVISKEDFMNSDEVFSNLKLRASYGRLGNDNVNPYQYIATYAYGTGYTNNGTDVKTLASAVSPNPDITWEVSDNINAGLEFGFFDNKLSFELDGFYIRTSNILTTANATVPNYIGLTLPTQNIGTMDNKGFEFQGSYKDKAGDFNYSVGANISWNLNSVIYMNEVTNVPSYQRQEGLPYGSTLVYKSIGIYRTAAEIAASPSYAGAAVGQLKFADLNGDGIIDSRDQYRYTVNLVAPIQFGVNFSFEYKGLDFGILITGQHGADYLLANTLNANKNNLAYIATNSYMAGNTNSLLPRIGTVGIGASDADFWHVTKTWVRLKSINLGYTFPFKEELAKIFVSKLRIFASFSNVALIYNSLAPYGTTDPEQISDYPIMTSFNFGVNLTF